MPHTVIADNAGGHLMQHGQVDVCIVGSDRTTATGDVANKIGTYLKALAARDNGVPFYAALPLSTIDWTLDDGVRQVPIEERSAREVTHMRGRTAGGSLEEVEVVAPGSPGAKSRVRRHTRAARHRASSPSAASRAASRAGCCAVSRDEQTLRTERMRDLANEIIAVTHALDEAGLVPNKSGNVSCRVADGFLITPAGMPYRELAPSHIVTLTARCAGGRPRSHGLRPSGACTPRSIARVRTSWRSSTRTVRARRRSRPPAAASRHSIT